MSPAEQLEEVQRAHDRMVQLGHEYAGLLEGQAVTALRTATNTLRRAGAVATTGDRS